MECHQLYTQVIFECHPVLQGFTEEFRKGLKFLKTMRHHSKMCTISPLPCPDITQTTQNCTCQAFTWGHTTRLVVAAPGRARGSHGSAAASLWRSFNTSAGADPRLVTTSASRAIACSPCNIQTEQRNFDDAVHWTYTTWHPDATGLIGFSGPWTKVHANHKLVQP